MTLFGYGVQPEAQGIYIVTAGADLEPGDTLGVLLSEPAARLLHAGRRRYRRARGPPGPADGAGERRPPARGARHSPLDLRLPRPALGGHRAARHAATRWARGRRPGLTPAREGRRRPFRGEPRRASARALPRAGGEQRRGPRGGGQAQAGLLHPALLCARRHEPGGRGAAGRHAAHHHRERAPGRDRDPARDRRRARHHRAPGARRGRGADA